MIDETAQYIAVALVIAIALAWIVRRIVRKKPGSGCGCGCSGCDDTNCSLRQDIDKSAEHQSKSQK